MEEMPLTLERHESKSEDRYNNLKQLIEKGHTKMSAADIMDKVNINVGSDGSGSGGAGLAAVIAALGNRNEGGDTAALIAALGNRNNDGAGLSALAPMLAAQNSGGMNNLWPIILLALLGRGRGGLLGGDGGDCGTAPINPAVLTALNNISSAIPTTALETQAAITNAIGALSLGTQQGFANVKDSVQATSALQLGAINNVGTAVQTGTLQTVIAIGNDGDKTRALIQSINDTNLNRELAVAQSALSEERSNRRIREVEVNVSQSVTQNQNQAQAQLQTQMQFQNLFGVLSNLANDLQQVKQGQVIFNSGAMTASGTQAAANTRVA